MTTRTSITVIGLALCATVAAMDRRGAVSAQSPAALRPDGGDAAVAALVAEVRALRADLKDASRQSLRAQMLVGRVQMQEQRLAYLDKQRSDAANAAMLQGQLTATMRGTIGGPGCASTPGDADARRQCEANFAGLRQQLAAQETREQQLRAQEQELATALAAEQARWNDFNARLDELEQTLR